MIVWALQSERSLSSSAAAARQRTDRAAAMAKDIVDAVAIAERLPDLARSSVMLRTTTWPSWGKGSKFSV